MWSHERQTHIITLLAKQPRVTTVDLAQSFHVSRETIRRDLLEMEEAGLVQRVHGGAISAHVSVEPEAAFDLRRTDHADKKAAIGAQALDIVPQGATCFIDTGTTTIAFARALALRGHIRVITNSFEIAKIMAGGHDCDVLLLGGRPHRDVPATFGEMALSQIDRFLADFAIISPVGLHVERGVTDYELQEAEVARAMMRRASQNIVLCHSDKIGVESRVSICRLDEIDHLVSDRDPRTEAIRLPRGQLHLTKVSV